MELQPELTDFAWRIKTIDSHTMGEATRIIYDGFPKLSGSTMMEKKNDLIQNYDFLRSALILEPRGHRDMFGVLLTEPVHPEANFGVVFMDSGGCLNMCGHGSIGTAAMLVDTKMVHVTEPYTEVVLDAPSGVIRAQVRVENGRAAEVSILNVPAFLYKENQSVSVVGYGTVPFDIAFGGSFFALVDAEEIGLSLNPENIDRIIDLGMELKEKINHEVTVQHPYLDIRTVDLVEFYSHTDTPEADLKNCVIFGDAQADRSPCGTGTSAKLAALFARGRLALNQEFVYESITGSLFRGRAVGEVDVGGRKGIIPQITGSAYITGCNEWILDDRDPMAYGFLLGKKVIKEQESDRSRIVCTAWELFRTKGYDNTTVDEVIERSGVDESVFYTYFQKKSDLENTLGDLFDKKYEELIISMNPRLTHYEKLLFLNQEMFELIEKEVPFDLVSHIYVTKAEEQKKLLDQHRFYYKLIPQIIREGQMTGEFRQDETAEDLADTYASLERGIIYDWCIKDGKESLQKKGQRLLSGFLKELLR